jgi:hypothetical protein
MEETGILENSTLHGLVLPHFEPGQIYQTQIRVLDINASGMYYFS